MKYLDHTTAGNYQIAILLKSDALRQDEIVKHYLEPMKAIGLPAERCISYSLEYNGKTAPVSLIKAYLGGLMPNMLTLGIEYLLVTDSSYFKVLTGMRKADPHHGHILPCVWENCEHIKVILSVNYKALFFNPDLQSKLTMSLETLSSEITGTHTLLGSGIIHSAVYSTTLEEIAAFLDSLHQYDSLTSDIETFSLKHYDSGLASITFCWDQHNGGAFPIDYVPIEEHKGVHGKQVFNRAVRDLLRNFFETYKGTLIWHNISFDAYILVYQLWMKDLLDQEGMLTGLEIMLNKYEDTKLITYLATNSCAGNHLSLKEQAHEFAGNYAVEDINDVTRIPLEKLLTYNVIDGLGTWFTLDKHYDTVVLDDQLDVYQNIFKPSVIDIIQMQLTGMCLDMDAVLVAEAHLSVLLTDAIEIITSSPLHDKAVLNLRLVKHAKDYSNRRKKAKHPENIKPKKFEDIKVIFNPNSGPNVQELLYTVMGLPVLDYTDNKQPAVGADTLEKLINHTDNPDEKKVIAALIDYAKVDKILTTFIPIFKAAQLAPDGHYYIYGSYNLGGAKSGRLSASNPNLQNLPSGSTYGTLIKNCFIAPKGYVFLGLDFNSLEDYISALTTRDPNKLKVYLEHYDGHCLRAYSYWPEKFTDLTLTPDSINSIKWRKDIKGWRDYSKPITFALTYQGTAHTLVKNCGFTLEEALRIEANYHSLYKVSTDWIQTKLVEASKVGYVTVAFGLRLRTPIMAQTVIGNSRTPFEAAAEGRTAGNAYGQSYGLLNNRACSAFMKIVRKSEYRLCIRLCSMIHDAQYMYAKDSFPLIAWINEHLVQAVQWQELPELQHATVKLGGNLSIFYPTWKDEIDIANYSDANQILEICKAAKIKREET